MKLTEKEKIIAIASNIILLVKDLIYFITSDFDSLNIDSMLTKKENISLIKINIETNKIKLIISILGKTKDKNIEEFKIKIDILNKINIFKNLKDIKDIIEMIMSEYNKGFIIEL